MLTNLPGYHSSQNLLTEIYLLQEAGDHGRWNKLKV